MLRLMQLHSFHTIRKWKWSLRSHQWLPLPMDLSFEPHAVMTKATSTSNTTTLTILCCCKNFPYINFIRNIFLKNQKGRGTWIKEAKQRRQFFCCSERARQASRSIKYPYFSHQTFSLYGFSLADESFPASRCLRDIFFIKTKIWDNSDKCQYKIINPN